MVMEASNLLNKAKEGRDLLRANFPKTRNRVSMLIGGIIGASTQEDNNNEIFTLPMATVIGAVTGLSLDFQSPVIQKREVPSSSVLVYDTEKLKRDFEVKNKKVENFISKIGRDEGRLSLLAKIKEKEEGELEEVKDELFKLETPQELQEELERKRSKTDRLLKEEKKVEDRIAALQKELDEKVSSLGKSKEGKSERAKIKKSYEGKISKLKEELSGRKISTIRHVDQTNDFEMNIPTQDKYDETRNDLTSEIQRREKKVARVNSRIEKTIDLNRSRSSIIGNTLDSLRDSGDVKVNSVLADAFDHAKSNPENLTPGKHLESIMENLKGNPDTKTVDKILKVVGMKVHDFQTGKIEVHNGVFGTGIGKVEKRDFARKHIPNQEVKVNNLTPLDERTKLIDDLLTGSNTPTEKVAGTRMALEKIMQESTDKGNTVHVTGDEIVVKNSRRTIGTYPIPKYGDNGERFTRSKGGTTFVAAGFNPFSSLLAKGEQFDFSQIGEAVSPDGKHVRIPNAFDVTRSYDGIEAVNFFGVNRKSAELASSLSEYISDEDIGRTRGDRTFKTGLGSTVSRNIELKHVLKGSSLDSAGKFTAEGKRLGRILETPTGGMASEVKSVIDSIIKDYPEAMAYGQTHTSRKTSIVDPNYKMTGLISPVPNAARGGQGVLNRGYKVKGNEALPDSISSSRVIKKQIITGQETAKAIPYLFGSSKTFADGFTLANRDRNELNMTKAGRMEIAPIGESFHFNIDKEIAIKDALTISDDVERQEYLREFSRDDTLATRAGGYGRQPDGTFKRNPFGSIARKEATDKFLAAAGGLNKQKEERLGRMLAGMDTTGVELFPGDIVGYDKNGSPISLPEYYSSGKVTDAKINLDGNLVLEYEGTYTPKGGAEEGKIFSQSTKSSFGTLDKKQFATISILDRLEEAGFAKFEKDGDDLTGIRIKLTDESKKIMFGNNGDYTINSLAPFNNRSPIEELVISGIDNEADFNKGGKSISIGSKMFGDILPNDIIHSYGNSNVMFPLSESGIDDLFNLQKAKNVDEVFTMGNSFLANYGIPNSKAYRSEVDVETIGRRIELHEEKFSRGLTNMSTLEFAKREVLAEGIYQTLTSENKIAPDIQTKLMDLEASGEVPEIDRRTIGGGLQHISDNKLLLSSDQDIRIKATEAVRAQTRAMAFSENVFSTKGHLTNMVARVAVEEGFEKVGAGNKARISWVAIDQMRKNGMTKEMLQEIAEYDVPALHELEMIRLNSVEVTENALKPENIEKKFIAPIRNALSLDPELRADALKRVMVNDDLFKTAGALDKSLGRISFNLTGPEVGDLKSLSFSTVTTGRSNVYSLADKEILSKMDKAKVEVLSSYLELKNAPDGSELRKGLTLELQDRIQTYKDFVVEAFDADGKSNILKSGAAMVGKKSEIRKVEPIGGYIANTLVPRLREESGLHSSYNVYSMGQMEEILGKYGLADDESIVFTEISTEEELQKNKFNKRAYKLERMHSDGILRPILEAETREPAQGPMSTLFKEIIISDEKEDTIEGKRSKTVGIPVRDGEKEVGSFAQKKDFDRDTTANIFIDSKNPEMQEKFLARKTAQDKFITQEKDWISKMGVKGKSKKMTSTDQMVKMANDRGVSPAQIWALESTSLAQKGVLRKTATPYVTSLGMSMGESIMESFYRGEIDEHQATSARTVIYDMLENILKTQHADTEKAVMPVPEIFRAMDLRKRFLAGEVQEDKYVNSLEKIIKSYTEPMGLAPESKAKYDDAVKVLVGADTKFGKIASITAANVMTTKRLGTEVAAESEDFFSKLTEGLNNSMVSSDRRESIYDVAEAGQRNGEVATPRKTLVEPAIDSIEARKVRAVGEADNLMKALTNKGNWKKLGLGAGALVATTIMIGREASVPANLDLGQDADRSNSVSIPNQNTGYLNNARTTDKNVRVSGVDNSAAAASLDRVIYGNTLVANRVRDERG